MFVRIIGASALYQKLHQINSWLNAGDMVFVKHRGEILFRLSRFQDSLTDEPKTPDISNT